MAKTLGIGSYNALNRDELKTEVFIYTVHNTLRKSSTSLNGLNVKIPKMSLRLETKYQDIY